MKTSELTGAALDWAVAKAEEFDADALVQLAKRVPGKDYGFFLTKYSTNWAQGGPIIEREGIGIDQYADYPRWQAFTPAPEQPSGQAVCNGDTPLIAAMRCYVASKLGDEVEIPKELT
jgi:hypothetical protein